MDDDDDTQVYKDDGNALLIAYQSGYYDGKKAALAGLERNFCPRCGKRTADLTTIHTCTPPQEKNNG
jgi:anti-sigma factor ChrR (cupin superfamily)